MDIALLLNPIQPAEHTPILHTSSKPARSSFGSASNADTISRSDGSPVTKTRRVFIRRPNDIELIKPEEAIPQHQQAMILELGKAHADLEFIHSHVHMPDGRGIPVGRIVWLLQNARPAIEHSR